MAFASRGGWPALGSAVHEHLVNFARQEPEAFDHECVTGWERIRYLERI